MNKFESIENHILVVKSIIAILLISLTFISPPRLLGQTKVNFKAVEAKIDTVGWYFLFLIPEGGAEQDRREMPIEGYEETKKIYDYLSVGGLPPNTPFQPMELKPDKENILENPFEDAYVAVTENEILIRLGYNFNGNYKVFGFRRLGTHVQLLTASTPLSQYFEMISFTLHSQLQSKSSSPGVLKDLQLACANYGSSFYTDPSCVVEYIKSNQLWDNVEFKEALRKIDPTTY